MNLGEYRLLLHSYKAMFYYLQGEVGAAQAEIKLAGEFKQKYLQDPVKLKMQINIPSSVQH